jgi:HopA1 effector protein family
MAPTIHADFFAVIDAVEIHSPTRFVLLGEIRDLMSAATGPKACVPEILATLENELYAQLYTRPFSSGNETIDFCSPEDLIFALSAANGGRGTWEGGWTFGSIEDNGQVTAMKGGITFWMPSCGIRNGPDGLHRGDSCQVRVPKELRYLVPDYYVAVGDADPSEEHDGPEPVVRFYWNVTAQAAVLYVAAVTEVLNARGIPFRTKVLSNPRLYPRADAGVLYLERGQYRRLGSAIQTIHLRIKADLNPQVPLFTKALAPGLGLGEDPGNGMSFGQHRCKLAAQGLWRSFLQGERTRETRAATVASQFREAGLKPAAPYLAPGSRDRYFLRPKSSLSSRVNKASRLGKTSRA